MPYPDDENLCSLAHLKGRLSPRPTGGLSSIDVVAGGVGYTVPPDVVITDAGKGTGAQAVAVLTAGVVTAVNITSPGNEYESPSVALVGDGSGAAAVAHIADDDALQLLITDVSQSILNQANINRFYDDGNPVTEVRNGNGKNKMLLRNSPVTSVISVSILGIGAIPPSNGTSSGYLVDYEARMLHLVGYCFPLTPQSVTLVYNCGESTPSLSQRARNAEEAAIMTACLWWKRRPYEHQTSDAVSLGTGGSASLGISQKPFPPAALEIISNLTTYRGMYA